MEQISLQTITKKDNTISFDFTISDGLHQFFSDQKFIIEYPESVESLPDAIAAVPFVCNVLPLIWLADATLIIPELDDDFYNSIPKIKNGYETMYPESEFKGKLVIGKIVSNDKNAISGKCAMFYSGGVDSMDTLFRHLEEKPILLSVWGSDIKFENIKGWELVHTAIVEAASSFQLEEMVIHSSFREFDKEITLTKSYSAQLKDNWWHGVKHGIALLGHVAPLAYLHGFEIMYIASSNCSADGAVRCASNPLIDNQVRFASCRVIHDGFEFSRQDKVRNIANYANKNNTYLPLHVCWESQKGTNCCFCEKCYRTIVALIVEGEDPNLFGFEGFEQYISHMLPVIKKDRGILNRQWTKIQKGLIINEKTVRKSSYWKYVSWIIKADFSNPETIQEPLFNRLTHTNGLRRELAKLKPYQYLHKWKEKLK